MSEHRISNRDFRISVAIMLTAAVCLSLVTLFAKQITALTSLEGAIFLRFFVPMLLLAWIAFVLFDGDLKVVDWKLHIWRAVFVLASQYCLFFYLSRGSLLLGTLLFSTSGLFLPFVTYFAFGLEIKRRTLAAIAISFVGVAVVLNPAVGFDWTMAIGLLAGLFNAGSQAVMHKSSKTTSTLTATLMMFALCSLGAFAVLIVVGDLGALASLITVQDPDAAHLPIVVALFAIATISNQSLRTKAYRYVNKPASLSPFYYAAIVFSGVLDWWVYAIVPGWDVYVGTALIFVGGAVMARRGRNPVEPHADVPA